MKKIALLIICGLFIATSFVNAAAAEDSIDKILDDQYGGGNWDLVDDTTEIAFQPTTFDVKVLMVDMQAGYTNPTGWYAVQGLAKNPLFSDPDSQINEVKAINPSVQFGFYIVPDSPAGTTYYSQASLNPNDEVRCQLYDIDIDKDGNFCDAYVLAFEDLSDGDYNDIVIELKPKPSLIPEFPTVALPVAAILGLVFIFGRKKEGL